MASSHGISSSDSTWLKSVTGRDHGTHETLLAEIWIHAITTSIQWNEKWSESKLHYVCGETKYGEWLKWTSFARYKSCWLHLIGTISAARHWRTALPNPFFSVILIMTLSEQKRFFARWSGLTANRNWLLCRYESLSPLEFELARGTRIHLSYIRSASFRFRSFYFAVVAVDVALLLFYHSRRSINFN